MTVIELGFESAPLVVQAHACRPGNSAIAFCGAKLEPRGIMYDPKSPFACPACNLQLKKYFASQ